MSIMGLPFQRLDEGTLTRRFLEGVRAGEGLDRHPESRHPAPIHHQPREPGADLAALSASPMANRSFGPRPAGTPLPETVPRLGLVLVCRACGRGVGLPLEARWPGLRGVGSYCPPLGFEDDPDELERIKRALRRARPELVLVGLGFPGSERLIRSLRSELPGTWFVGVGISLSFLAGEQRRA